LIISIQNITYGLLGKYSKNYLDDFTLPNGQQINVQSSQEDIHTRFGMAYRVHDRIGIGEEHKVASLFHHNAISFAYYDDPNFIPEFRLPPPLPEYAQFLQNDMDHVCADSKACQYDYVMTLDKDFAKITKEFEAQAHRLQSEITTKGKINIFNRLIKKLLIYLLKTIMNSTNYSDN